MRLIGLIAAAVVDGQQPILDFKGLCGVALVTGSASITFDGLILKNIDMPRDCMAMSQLQERNQTALLPSWGYTPFPAIFVLPNATVCLPLHIPVCSPGSSAHFLQ